MSRAWSNGQHQRLTGARQPAGLLFALVLTITSFPLSTDSVAAVTPGTNGPVLYHGCSETTADDCGIWLMDPDGGNKRILTSQEWGEARWSPDADYVSYVDGEGDLYLYTVATGASRRLVDAFGEDWTVISHTWSPDATRIGFVRAGFHDCMLDDTSCVSIVDIASGAISDMPEPFPAWGPGSISWSPDGTQLAFIGPLGEDSNRYGLGLVYLNGTGLIDLFAQESLIGGSNISWAPDGESLAFVLEGDLAVYSGGSVTTLGFTSHWYPGPAWSPDSDWIYFQDGGAADVLRVHPDGTSPQRLTAFDSQTDLGGGNSPDVQCVGSTCVLPPDRDSDGTPDSSDNCPDKWNMDQRDDDGDGIGNVCDDDGGCTDGDTDCDGVDDALDNCPVTFNPGQEDSDGDGIGDACDDDGGTQDSDGDGFGDSIEVAYASDKDDINSRPVTPPGWIEDPMGNGPDTFCGLKVGINTCNLLPGDVIVWRFSDGPESFLESFLGNTYWTHSLLVVGRFDMDGDLDGNNQLDVVLVDITPGRDPAELAVKAYEGHQQLLDGAVTTGPDAVWVYRPGLSRSVRERAAREALLIAWDAGASDPGNRSGSVWAAPGVSFTKLATGAFGPEQYYCSSLIAVAYDVDHLDWPALYPGLTAMPYLTPDMLIELIPGMHEVESRGVGGGTIGLWSPAHVLLTDTEGRRSGVDADGSVVDEIPGALVRVTEQNESVSAPGMTPDWTIDVNGYGSGVYDLTFDDSSSSDFPIAVSGFTRDGLSEQFTIGELPDLTDNPVAVDDFAMASARGRQMTVNIAVLANDLDPGDTALSVTGHSIPNFGAVLCDAFACRYTVDPKKLPKRGQSWTDTFTYQLANELGGTDSAVVTITIMKGGK